MKHVVLWVVHHVIHKLTCLGVLYWQVILLDDRFHEELVDELSVSLPYLAIVCDEHMIAACDEVVAHIAMWPI